MKSRQNFSSGAKWEDIVGYSRAVRVGNVIETSGTVSIVNGELYGKGDPYLQTKRCLEIIEEYILKAGGRLEDIIRTRIYVTDISLWSEIGKAHGEYFKSIKPVTSMVEVSKLIDPDYLVEIEASAIVQ
ncbi:RidA family protein [Fulvivirga lutea]|uniref:RidA family protein n=1 Tax=Fulvivirga lutea TaxID=2810512 RepID=A0A974WJ43_9BACT|nr:RidA family protein [Fulvivirga lutea]QSE98152.1 RidA family protein [Fulvivirga lutea]